MNFYEKLVYYVSVLAIVIIVLYYGPYAKNDLVWYKMNAWLFLIGTVATYILLILESYSSGDNVCLGRS